MGRDPVATALRARAKALRQQQERLEALLDPQDSGRGLSARDSVAAETELRRCTEARVKVAAELAEHQTRMRELEAAERLTGIVEIEENVVPPPARTRAQ